jgi:hypothetical protein
LLLRKYEEDAQFAVSSAKRKMNKNGSDKNKQAYYDAVAKYDFISKQTGPTSPAKEAAKARAVKAAELKARDELAQALSRAKNMKQVAKALIAATKGNSKAAEALKDARTNEDAKAVLTIVAKDKKAAKLLA